jgi:hypothetical protein
VLGQGTEDEFLERFRHDLPQDDQQMLIFGTSRGSSRIWGCRAAVAGGVLLVNSRYLDCNAPPSLFTLPTFDHASCDAVARENALLAAAKYLVARFRACHGSVASP